MKNSKTNSLLMALLAIQTIAYAQDALEKPEDLQPSRSWRQAAWDNRYNIAAGTAAVGLGALGYAYGQNFMTWFNQLSPAEQEQVQQKLKESVDQDLENIQHQQKSVVEQEVIVAEQEQGITQAQQQVAEKQSWLQYILNMRKNDPALNKIQEELALNPEDRPSDENLDGQSNNWSADYERKSKDNEAYRANLATKKAQDNVDFIRGRKAMNALPGVFDAASLSVKDIQKLGSGLRTQESLVPKKYKSSIKQIENNASQQAVAAEREAVESEQMAQENEASKIAANPSMTTTPENNDDADFWVSNREDNHQSVPMNRLLVSKREGNAQIEETNQERKLRERAEIKERLSKPSQKHNEWLARLASQKSNDLEDTSSGLEDIME